MVMADIANDAGHHQAPTAAGGEQWQGSRINALVRSSAAAADSALPSASPAPRTLGRSPIERLERRIGAVAPAELAAVRAILRDLLDL